MTPASPSRWRDGPTDHASGHNLPRFDMAATWGGNGARSLGWCVVSGNGTGEGEVSAARGDGCGEREPGAGRHGCRPRGHDGTHVGGAFRRRRGGGPPGGWVKTIETSEMRSYEKEASKTTCPAGGRGTNGLDAGSISFVQMYNCYHAWTK